MLPIDVEANRAALNWSRPELAGRVLWALAKPFFFLSPRLFWGWRRALLRLFGATVGRDVHVYPTVRIAIPWNLSIDDHVAIGDRVILYNLGPVTIGARATVSQGVHVCAGTHDYREPSMPLVKDPISIGCGAWVCADAFIGPNVVVGDYAIVGARAVVVSDIPPSTIVAGNPAVSIGQR